METCRLLRDYQPAQRREIAEAMQKPRREHEKNKTESSGFEP